MEIMLETLRMEKATTKEVGRGRVGWINCKVDCRVNGEIVEAWARKDEESGRLTVYGFFGKYVTGKKLWPAAIMLMPEGKMIVSFGRDDNGFSKFRKENLLIFMPDRFFGLNRIDIMPESTQDLIDAYGGFWGEHPDYPSKDWRAEVKARETRLGYWDWVLNKYKNQN